MSASAQEPGSPFSVSKECNDSPKKVAPLAGRAAAGGHLADDLSKEAPKTARQPGSNQNPARPDLGGRPTGARPEAPQASQLPWKVKRPRRAFAGDVAMAELRSDLADVPDERSEPQAP